MITVDEIMSVELRTLTTNDTLADAQSMMANAHIHHIPIVEGDNQLVGIVSHRDVLASMEPGKSSDSIAQNPSDISVHEFMTRDVTTVDPRANLRQAAVFLQRHSYGCLPVVESGKLVGIVTDTDFVGVAINLLEQMEEGEPADV
jgi:CBS domain-containing membrane protein